MSAAELFESDIPYNLDDKEKASEIEEYIKFL